MKFGLYLFTACEKWLPWAVLVPVLLAGEVCGVDEVADGDVLRVAYVEHQQETMMRFFGNQWMYYGGYNMRQFLGKLGKQTNIKLETEHESVSFRDEDLDRLFDYAVLFMTSNYAPKLSEEEVRNMREYLLRGGFLLADDCILEGSYSGNQLPAFTRGMQEAMKKVFPDRSFEVIAHDHPVYHCFYQFEGGFPRCHPDGHWEGLGLFDGDRLMVLLSPNDLCCGWQFNWGVQTQNAYEMGINIFIYALTH